MYQRISLLRFIFFYPPYIHNIHLSSRKIIFEFETHELEIIKNCHSF